jgi:hypothetical protein
LDFFFFWWQVKFPDIATRAKACEAQDYKTFTKILSHVKTLSEKQLV